MAGEPNLLALPEDLQKERPLRGAEESHGDGFTVYESTNAEVSYSYIDRFLFLSLLCLRGIQ